MRFKKIVDIPDNSLLKILLSKIPEQIEKKEVGLTVLIGKILPFFAV